MSNAKIIVTGQLDNQLLVFGTNTQVDQLVATQMKYLLNNTNMIQHIACCTKIFKIESK